MPFVLQFDARTVAPNVIPEPVPSAIYTAAIIKSEEKPAKNTPGASYYEFTEQIIEGEFKGRTLTDRLNCKNPSPQAVDIAYSTLSSICHVTGVFQLSNSQELHGKPFKINVVKIPRNDDPSRMTNEIRGYLHLDGSEPGKAAIAQQTAPAGFSTGAPNGQTAAFAPPPQQQFAPPPQQQFAPPPQAAPAPAPQQFAPPAQAFAPPPQQQFAPPPAQAAPQPVFQRSDGVLVNAAGMPVDQYGNPLPQAAAPAPIPQQYQPAPQPQPTNGAPSATPDWAK